MGDRVDQNQSLEPTSDEQAFIDSHTPVSNDGNTAILSSPTGSQISINKNEVPEKSWNIISNMFGSPSAAPADQPKTKTTELSPLQKKYNLEIYSHGNNPKNLIGPHGEPPQEVDPEYLRMAQVEQEAEENKQKALEYRQNLGAQVQQSARSALGFPSVQPASYTTADNTLPSSGAAEQLKQSQQGTQQQTDVPNVDINQLYKNQINAAEQAAQSQTDLAKAQQGIYSDQAAQMKAVNEAYNTHLKAIDDENSQLMNAYAQQKINPRAVFDNMDTGNKLMASVGLLLGGIGQGLLHTQTNPAMDVINKALDRDIESQKLNMDKTRNLLTMNMEKYRNLDAATAATRANQLAVTSSMLNQAIQKAQPGIIQSQLLQTKSQIDLQRFQMQRDLALFNVNASAVSGEGVPAHLLPYVSKDISGNMVPLPNGNYAAARDKDAAKTVTDTIAPYQTLMGLMHEMDKLGPSALVPGTSANQQAHALAGQTVLELNSLHGLKRISDKDVEIQSNTFRDPTKFSQFLAGGSRNSALGKFLDSKVDSVYRANVPAYKPKYVPSTLGAFAQGNQTVGQR